MAKAKRKAARRSKRAAGVTYAQVCEMALKLPGVEESTSYGTAALKVRGTLMVRLKEDGVTLVLRTTLNDRPLLLAAAPDVLYLTDHYVKHPWVLVRLQVVEQSFLKELLGEAWRLAAQS